LSPLSSYNIEKENFFVKQAVKMPAMKIVRFGNAEMGKSPLSWEID
jgi:hypothetical protein